jgi:hypothetical protein
MKGAAHTLRQRVFLFILECDHKGATLEEIEEGMALAGNTVRPRRVELEERSLVAPSGFTRPTKSGRQAIVWIVPTSIAATARRILATKGISL